MRKHQLTDITWREVRYQRPFELESIWETLVHLAAATPRGAIVWEVRGCKGKVTYLLGADKIYINNIMGVFLAHGDIQFREIPDQARQMAVTARTLKISHPSLSLNTDITDAAVRAGLAALAQDKSGRTTIIQVVLGRSCAPSSVPAEFPDPAANWLDVIMGNVSKATTETRRTVREKAEQYSFQTAIRIGVSKSGGFMQLRNIVSALRVLGSVHIRASTISAKKTKAKKMTSSLS